MTVEKYYFYAGDGGGQITARWLPSDQAAEKYARELCDEMGISIEVCRGEELDLIAVYDPD